MFESMWGNLALHAFTILVHIYHGYYGLMRAEHSTALLLQEECDVLILVLSKNTEPIALSDFRAVMLATLRLVAGMLGGPL